MTDEFIEVKSIGNVTKFEHIKQKRSLASNTTSKDTNSKLKSIPQVMFLRHFCYDLEIGRVVFRSQPEELCETFKIIYFISLELS